MSTLPQRSQKYNLPISACFPREIRGLIFPISTNNLSNIYIVLRKSGWETGFAGMGARFKTGVEISGAPTGGRRKAIFGGGLCPAAKNHSKKGITATNAPFTPKLERTL
ncbi:MAG: hypothetical protein RBT75_17875 [Anaerolineae bacterium]|nr:hypothetical protein [Anaerolineae bacterium]